MAVRRARWIPVAAALALSPMITSVAAAQSAAARFSPFSVSFPNATVGWALGLASCDGGTYCYRLERTVDSARTWATMPLPITLRSRTEDSPWYFYEPTLVAIDFADRNSGWIYGELPTAWRFGGPWRSVVRLWATTDAGRSWSEVNLAPLPTAAAIFAVASHGGHAYLLGTNDYGSATIATATVGSNHWRRMPAAALEMPAGGTGLQAGFVFSGSTTWLVAGNDRGMTMSDKLATSGRWVRLPDPCRRSGDAMTVPVALSPSHLLAECDVGGYSASLPPASPPGAVPGLAWLYQSTNGGESYEPLRAVEDVRPQPYYFLFAGSGLPAAPAPGTIIAAAPVGGRARETLIESVDSGRTWRTVYTGNVLSAAFPSASLGAVISQSTTTTSRLVVTRDLGRTWSVASFSP